MRVGATIDAERLRFILMALKAIGFSLTLLCDAAIALTILKRNRNLDVDSQYIHGNTMYVPRHVYNGREN